MVVELMVEPTVEPMVELMVEPSRAAALMQEAAALPLGSPKQQELLTRAMRMHVSIAESASAPLVTMGQPTAALAASSVVVLMQQAAALAPGSPEQLQLLMKAMDVQVDGVEGAESGQSAKLDARESAVTVTNDEFVEVMQSHSCSVREKLLEQAHLLRSETSIALAALFAGKGAPSTTLPPREHPSGSGWAMHSNTVPGTLHERFFLHSASGASVVLSGAYATAARRSVAPISSPPSTSEQQTKTQSSALPPLPSQLAQRRVARNRISTRSGVMAPSPGLSPNLRVLSTQELSTAVSTFTRVPALRTSGLRRSAQPPQRASGIATSAKRTVEPQPQTRRTVVPQPQTRTDINASALLWLAEPKSTISPSINSKSKWGHESYDPDQARAMRPSIDTLPAALRRRLERGGVAPRTVV